jgi:hypothetical protein
MIIDIKIQRVDLNFEEEYFKRCESLKLEPFQIRRLPYPPPGYPNSQKDSASQAPQKSGTADQALASAATPGQESNIGKANPTTAGSKTASSTTATAKKKTDGTAVSTTASNQQQSTGSGKDKDFNEQIGTQGQLLQSSNKYKLEPTILLENGHDNGTDNHSVYKVQVRGWELSRPMMEAVVGALPSCGSITHLT